MKKIIALGLIMLFAGVLLFAIEIDIEVPTIGGSSTYGYLDFDLALGQFKTEANDILSKVDSMNNLVKAMSNATSFAADGATTRNFFEYKMFAVAIGTMGALQSSSFNISDTADKVENSEDIYFGINAQAITVSAGINLGLLVDGLYVTGKIGSFSYSIQDFDISMFSCGLLAQYQLIESKKALLASWKGVQVGTGFIYYSSDISFNTNTSVSTRVDLQDLGGGLGNQSATLAYDPKLDTKFETKGIKIPIDVMTGVRIAILDLSFGLGVDINVWSNSDLTYKAEGPTYFTDIPSGLESNPGHVNVKGGTTGKSADFLKFKTMAGVGVSLGPVKLDIPVTYYFGTDGPGANVGVTVGLVK